MSSDIAVKENTDSKHMGFSLELQGISQFVGFVRFLA